MIKGCQKKIIIVEGSESSPFETAFFVLRKDSEDCCTGGDDILREADRIITESIPDVQSKHRRRSKTIRLLTFCACFIGGIVVGSGIFILASFL